MKYILLLSTLLLIICERGLCRSPFVIVPGIAGSQLWAFEQDPSKRWQIWVSLDEIYAERKVVPLLKLDYDLRKRRPVDNHELSTGPGYYGSTRGIDYLDDSLQFGITGAYMVYLVDFFVKNDPFYVRNKTVRGASFDFRFTPRDKPEMLTDLKALIEETYKNSNNTKVTLLGHSYGSANAVIFLNNMSKQWRATYIKQFVSISGVFGGSVKALKAHISGDKVNLPFIYSSTLRPLLRTMSGLSAILPQVDVFDEENLVLTDEGNFTSRQYRELYTRLDSMNSFYMWEDNEHMFSKQTIPPSDVKCVCIYGYGLDTIRQLDYRNGRFPDYDPKMIFGNGDGTVNIESLELCKKWSQVELFTLEKAEHFAIVSDKRLFDLIKTII
ncbi:hypothetical protein Ciccas_007495 [Cichlidogyrus casuarinus]|uniref:Uncharacterized protein n=1 Tax=Cichlidogyrus casuarinus TaxID=1844966 RepID=A0ABD2Q5B7_9PLAT